VARSLGLMCGAGGLPALMAAEARRQGWRVVAFTFGDAMGIASHADRVIPSRINELAGVLETLLQEGVTALLFSGKFWMRDVLNTARPDVTSTYIAERAGSLADARLSQALVDTLGGVGITVLDQRPFFGPWVVERGCLSARQPTDEEWIDIRRGLVLARTLADHGIGQTVVLKRGAVAAVEAMEGTTDAIRRGTALAGRGAVAVKAVAPDNDYRFDVPAIGPETVRALSEGDAAAMAIEAGRVLVLEREATIRAADASGIAIVSVDGDPE
jgi:DUF1009 family protein